MSTALETQKSTFLSFLESVFSSLSLREDGVTVQEKSAARMLIRYNSNQNMKVLGIEFASSQMTYVLVERAANGQRSITGSNRLSLGDTRSRDALRAFQSAVQTLFNDTAPDLVAIKEKPEKGNLQAGAAALKMEGIVLANAPCATEFVSGARINKCDDTAGSLRAYHQPAFKAAVVVLTDH